MPEEKAQRGNARQTSQRNTEATPGKPDAPTPGIGTTLLGFAILGVGVLAIVGLVVLLSGGDDSGSDAASASDTSTSELSDAVKDAAINQVMQERLVRDAAIVQDGDTLSLVLIVNAATNEEYARQVGDNFVRMVKSMGPDSSPGKEIGSGDYNYMISVYTPAEEEIVAGTKTAHQDSISW